MENASKALLIAAAVLIAIVIISIGVIVINSQSGTTKQAKESGETMETATVGMVGKIKSGEGYAGESTKLTWGETGSGNHEEENPEGGNPGQTAEEFYNGNPVINDEEQNRRRI